MFNRNPGDNLKENDIYEVWGDVVKDAADAGEAIITDLYDYLSVYFTCKKTFAREDNRPFLSVQWGELVADIDARPFGDHLDVYAILGLRQKLLDVPDPTARIAKLDGGERRDLQVFQTLLKWAMEEVLTALDEGRV